MTTKAQPTQASNRIVSLDILRGFALMGILIMNIISFSLPGVHYINPMVEGMLTGADKWAFYFSEIFANQKMMSLFSLLFGAGIVLLTSRMESKGLSPAKRHYTRNWWLLIFGLIHAYLIWYGDVLVAYAICSIWLFFFRKKSAKTLFIWAGIFLLIKLIINVSFSFMPPEMLAEVCKIWQPSAEMLAAKVAAFTGSLSGRLAAQAKETLGLQTSFLLIDSVWHITGMMLLGMGLFKSNILNASRSKAFYQKMMFIGLTIGISIGIFGLAQHNANGWTCEGVFMSGRPYNYLACLPMVLGYVGLVMLLCKSSVAGILQNNIAPFGRMALTNYLMQSIIATTIFYGHGFGLFNTVGRAEQWFFIIGIWTVQILFSKWWMKRFKFGPFEWVWRSLTYWKMQPMR